MGNSNTIEYAAPDATAATNPFRRTLHICAVITLLTTFPLIWMGGLVTSKDAGMSVPDWPNSYGYNMFTFPVSQWVGGIFFEHSHRLLGTVTGMAAIVLFATALLTEKRPWVKWLCFSVLIAVCIQGALGGMRVRLKMLDLAIVHGVFAQLFFCLAGLTCVVTSRWWFTTGRVSDSSLKAIRKLTYVSAGCVVLIIAQLAIAACMRHYKAGLAIPDFPTVFGGVFPPTSDTDLAAAQKYRLAHFQLPAASMSQIWLHFAHRIGALVISTVESIAVALVILKLRHIQRLTIYAGAITLLLVAQVTLGILTVILSKPADIATAHVATGALLLLITFLMTAITMRMLAVNLVTVPEKNLRLRERPARQSLETSAEPATI